MSVWSNGSAKEKLIKHFMNIFFKEACFPSQEDYAETDHKVSFSSFSSLHPKNILLLNDSPQDPSKSKIHGSFLSRLDAMGNEFDHEFWDAVLCDISLNSDYGWHCNCCKNGAKCMPKKQGSEVTNYK